MAMIEKLRDAPPGIDALKAVGKISSTRMSSSRFSMKRGDKAAEFGSSAS
jgi:hypothetical protein